jgi:TetR/AcrR family transcriptional regulator, fatty acid metabolism regulator protein
MQLQGNGPTFVIDESISVGYAAPMVAEYQFQSLGSNSPRRADPREAIFEAACVVIREKGFHQARISDIAAKAGISYGLVYHYYKNKADLLDAIIKEWWNGLYASMEEYETGNEPVRTKLLAVVDYFLDQYQTRPNLVHIFITEISRSTANLTADRLDWFKRFFDKIEQVISRAQSEGVLRADIKARYLTYVFLGSLESFVSALVLENQPLRGDTQRRRIALSIVEVFLNGAKADEFKSR